MNDNWEDPIVQDVRQARAQHAARFGYDLQAIVADLRAQEKTNHSKIVVSKPKKPLVFPVYQTKKSVHQVHDE